MIPVSVLHFLVDLAYLVLGLAGLKMIAVKFPDSAPGKALGFLLF